MVIPKQIQDMVDKATELEKKFGETNPPEAAEEGEQQEGQGAVTEVPEDIPGEDVTAQFESQEDASEEGEEAQQEEPEKPVDWEHKYKVLQGKYNAEVPRLHKEIKALKKEKEDLLARIQLLEQMVMQMQATQMQAPAPTPQPTPTEEVEDDDLKALKENYPEVYNALQKLLSKQVATEIKPQIEQVAEQTFYTQLSALVPDWQTINVDPKFLAWLNQVDPVSGYTKHQLLRMAYEERDAVKVARFFQAYKQEQQQQVSAEEASTTPTTPSTPPATKAAAPPHRRTAANPARRTNKRVYKQSEIEAFYRDAALGKIPPDEWRNLEKELVAAVVEGRVLYNK